MAQSNWNERHSNNMPPLLLGAENYNDWKFRMKIFLQRDAFEWDVVENGVNIPMTDGKPKNVKELTPDEINSLNFNARAMNSLLNGMASTELRKVSACTSAKQIWDTIKISHEGTSKVREVKLDLLMSDYESFRLEKDESIKEAQGRFLTLMNSISLLERHIPQSEINRKLLRSLPKKFSAKVTTLQDSPLISNMETLTLFSELEEFENQLRRYDEEDAAPRRKTLALNAEADESPEDSDEEIALITQRFKKFLAKKKSSNRFTPKSQFPKKEFKSSSNDDTCFECGKKGHFKKDCFKYKAKLKSSNNKDFKEKKKSKAFLTWSDDESEIEIDSDDEVAQVCLAGIEENSSDDDEVQSINAIPFSSRNRLTLQVENQKLREKNAFLKQALDSLLSETEDFMRDEVHAAETKTLSDKLSKMLEENEYLKNEIEMKDLCLAELKKETASITNEAVNKRESAENLISELQQKIIQLEKDLAKFVHGEETLNAMLGNQRSTLDKAGIGYNQVKRTVFKQSHKRVSMKYKMPYEKSDTKGHPTSRSFGTQDQFPKPSSSNNSKHTSVNIVQMWIKKVDRHLYKIHDTNSSGPKVMWVPKK